MIDIREIEKQILEFWDKNKIYEKSKKKNSKGKKFYFLQGPPYTSGRLHIGHAWNNSMKDIAMRYFRMKGCDVWDRAGYDMHGLPTANKVQKELNLDDKEAILKFGLDKFIKKCQEFSTKNAEQMNQDLKRLGIWMDFENAYLPVTNEFMSAEWLLIKEAHNQKRLYKGNKIMHWCGECETSLAKHELVYENIREKSIYVALQLKDKEGFLVIWTTTPWTIPFNLAVMVNPNLEYAKLSTKTGIYYVAKELSKNFAEKIIEDENSKVLETIKGKEMEGWEYLHPFSDVIDYNSLKKESPKIHTILLSKEFVNLETGTGLVHSAPGCGPEDYEVAKKYKIKPFNTLTEQGKFCDVGEFNGLKAKEEDWKFIKALDDRRVLLGEEMVSHEYPHCWRCRKPVLFKTTKQWFLKIEDLVPKILDYDKNIKWQPEVSKKNYETWISNIKDNGITRQRFWGTPAPIWECECGYLEIIGSQQELKKKAINKLPENLHKPWIDEVKLKCPKCKKEISRISDVIDVWIDSGTVSWNCLEYPQKKDLFKKYFPADLILEATEQTRLWFSMLQLCSTILFKKQSYIGAYNHGMILDFQGTKMSKSLGNIISPYEVIDKFSSEILRYYICETSAGKNINFSWEDVKQKQRNLLVLLNTANYLIQLKTKETKTKNLEEEFILSRLNSTIKKTTELFEEYKFDQTITEIESLFLDISRAYIKLTREKSNANPEIVYSALKQAYIKTLQMFSTCCPLFTEHIWQKLRENKIVKEESIHLSEWPKPNLKQINKTLEKQFENTFEIIETGLAERDKAQIGLKWPLAKATIVSELKPSKELQEIIKQQLNVKKIESKNGKPISVKLDTKITPELEAEGYARQISRLVQSERKQAELIKTDLIDLEIVSNLASKLQSQKEFIKNRVNAKNIEILEEGSGKNFNHSKEEKIKQNQFVIKFNKIIRRRQKLDNIC